eukprot:g10461.t1
MSCSGFLLLLVLSFIPCNEAQYFKPQPSVVQRPGPAARPPPNGYTNLEGVIGRMVAMVQKNPKLVQVVNLTKWLEDDKVQKTFEGRDIFALRMTEDVSYVRNPKPRLLLVAGEHAREVVVVEAALKFAERLVDYYGKDLNATSLLRNNELWVVPVVNVDGYAFVTSQDNFWRKNRKIDSSSPYIGVDVNRNFPFRFGSIEACTGSLRPQDETYRGAFGGSERETQVLMALTHNQRFAKLLDLHNYGPHTVYGFCEGTPPHHFQDWLEQEAIHITKSFYSDLMGSDWDKRKLPDANTEFYSWHQAQYDALSFLTEVGLWNYNGITFQPDISEALATANNMYAPMLDWFNRPLPLTGVITDEFGGPVWVNFTIDNVVADSMTKFQSHPLTGRYFFNAPVGSYTLRFSAPGYYVLRVDINLPAGGLVRNYAMKRINDVVPSSTSVPTLTAALTAAPLLGFVEDVWPLWVQLGVKNGHGQGSFLDMSTPENAYKNTVRKQSAQANMQLIQPCSSSQSYLYHKLAGTHLYFGGKGSRMPFGQASATSDMLRVVADWINNGAPFQRDVLAWSCSSSSSSSTSPTTTTTASTTSTTTTTTSTTTTTTPKSTTTTTTTTTPTTTPTTTTTTTTTTKPPTTTTTTPTTATPTTTTTTTNPPTTTTTTTTKPPTITTTTTTSTTTSPATTTTTTSKIRESVRVEESVSRPNFESHIWPIMQSLGGLQGHGANGLSRSVLYMPTALVAYNSLVGVNSLELPSMQLVMPCQPDKSYLLHKLGGSHMTVGGFGSSMPPPSSGHAPASSEQFAEFVRWIKAGAPYSARDLGVDCRLANPPALTFVDVIWPMFAMAGVTDGHAASGEGMSALTLPNARVAYQNLLNRKSVEVNMRLLVPCDSQQSYLVHKLAGTHIFVGGSGSQMPKHGKALSEDQLGMLAAWINEGAVYDGSSPSGQCTKRLSDMLQDDSSSVMWHFPLSSTSKPSTSTTSPPLRTTSSAPVHLEDDSSVSTGIMPWRSTTKPSFSTTATTTSTTKPLTTTARPQILTTSTTSAPRSTTSTTTSTTTSAPRSTTSTPRSTTTTSSTVSTVNRHDFDLFDHSFDLFEESEDQGSIDIGIPWQTGSTTSTTTSTATTTTIRPPTTTTTRPPTTTTTTRPQENGKSTGPEFDLFDQSFDLFEDSHGDETSSRLSWMFDIWPVLLQLRVLGGHGGWGDSSKVLLLPDVTTAYDNLVNRPSKQQPAMMLVAPCDHKKSYMFHKLAGSHTTVGGQGSSMPMSAVD